MWGTMAEPADGPKALHKPRLPRDFSAGTCKAASDLWWDSVSSSFSCSCAPWSSVEEHELSATSVGTLGQAPPEPHSAGEQGTASQ